MIFRGVMMDIPAMRDFMHMVQGISKLSKESIMRLTERKLYFIVSADDGGTRKPCVWCELPVTYYFKDYTIVGVSPESNEIYLSFDTVLLAKSTMTLKNNAKSLKIKLTNKQCPCLTLVVEQVSEGAQTRQCTHDIPVEIIQKKYWVDYAEPSFDDFHVTMHMPNLKSIKNIVERMKNISPTLIVMANKNGTLTLKSETNMVTISAHFPDLSVQSFAVGQVTNLDDTEDAECVSSVVDVKKFLTFLTGMHLNNSRTTCSIVQGQMVKLHIEQNGILSLQFFLSEINL